MVINRNPVRATVISRDGTRDRASARVRVIIRVRARDIGRTKAKIGLG